jgi:hypothetical protein
MNLAYTGAVVSVAPNKVHTAFVVTADELKQIAGGADSGKGTKLSDVLGAIPAGGLATGALKMYQLGNTTSQDELVKFMLTNNVSPAHAGDLSQQVLNVVNSSGAKAVFIGFAGGAATFGVLEVIRPHWSWQKKTLWSLAIATVISVIYLALVNLGIMR